jgi:hypothetical protein
VTITFRTSIGEYTGKGSPLTKEEVDGNFHDLLTRTITLEDGGLFSCESVDYTGTAITFNWSDDTSSGPFVLPVATFTARGVWLNDTMYMYLDVVTVVGVGTFLVQIEHTTPSLPAGFDPAAVNESDELLYLRLADAVDTETVLTYRGDFTASTSYFVNDLLSSSEYGLFYTLVGHTSDVTFDPDAVDDDDNPLYKKLAGPPFAPFEELTATTKTLSLADVGKVFRCPNGCDVTFPDDVDFPVSTEISFRQTGTDPVNFLEGGTDVVINPQREGFDTSTPYQGALVTAKFVSATEIDLIGPYGDEIT